MRAIFSGENTLRKLQVVVRPSAMFQSHRIQTCLASNSVQTSNNSVRWKEIAKFSKKASHDLFKNLDIEDK